MKVSLTDPRSIDTTKSNSHKLDTTSGTGKLTQQVDSDRDSDDDEETNVNFDLAQLQFTQAVDKELRFVE